MIPNYPNLVVSHIYLWGFMGSGKTTIGRELAQRIGYEFLDLDGVIESIEKMKVSDIFSHKGEKYFRELEKETLYQVTRTQERIVISTGGGAPCYSENAEFMNKTGATIYLKVSKKTLKKRLKTDEYDARPLLTSLSWLEIMDLYQTRQKYYDSAQFKVSNDQDMNICLEKIIEYLRQR